MATNSKQNIIKQIQELVDSLEFSDRIPNRVNSDKVKLEKVIADLGKKVITPYILNEIIGDLAFEEILEKTKHDDEKTKGLKKFSELPNVNSLDVATRTYSVISGLPAEYTFLFSLPKSAVKFDKIEYAHKTELLVFDDKLIQQYGAKESETKRLSDLLSSYKQGPRMKEGDVVLRISGKGYVGKYGSVKVNVIDPLYVFKVIIGVYVALEILKRKKDISSLGWPSEFGYSVYQADDTYLRTLSESTEDAQYLSRMEFNETKFVLSDLDKLLKKTRTEFEMANQIISILFKTIRFAKGKTDDKVTRRQRMIKNGAYWYYESLKSNEDHNRAIYLTTAFDSLLAVKGNEETKEHKAEIVANVIANNLLESDVIYKSIVDLYDLRNKIVHGEKEISSLEKYGEYMSSSTQTIVGMGLLYLSKFLFNRIHFINSGLSIVARATQKR